MKICIINTGGTISMTRGESGYTPCPGYVEAQLKQLPEFHHPDTPDFDIKEYEPLLDSANMHPREWNRLAQGIADLYDAYDGFVILHGTDTMSYTACALSFMLENLAKPVILTGSQIPFSEIRNDARNNLLNAMLLASRYPIAEVCICFNDVLIRGNRSQKTNSHHFGAFTSSRFPVLAKVGIDVETFKSRWLPKPDATHLQIQTIQEHPIATFRLFPGMSLSILSNLLQAPLKGLILETYGSGNAPNDDGLLNILKQGSEAGIIIVNCTQCQQGKVNMQHYETGHKLSHYVISGYDMTSEAAITKLMYLLSKNLSIEETKHLMQTNLRGEMNN